MRCTLLLLWVVAASCVGEPPAPPVPENARWLLEGSNDARLVRVAAHLRGFDVAMVETGYRYGELFWAVQDRNWDYASYQLGKIETAVTRGLERRPLRAPSARMLEPAVSEVRAALTAKDGAALDVAMSRLTATCNACHQAERVAFIFVVPPPVRTTVVRAAEGPPQAP